MRMVAWILLGLVAVAALVSLYVEREADYVMEWLGGEGPTRALVLYHPSRDARFSDDLSAALAEGLEEVGLAVDRATMTGETPARPQAYDLIGVVSNTYWWTPDLPTLRYLARAQLEGVPAVGLIGGAGATGRSERLLRERLQRAGAEVLDTRSFWLWRPNDESRMDESNRDVALELARRLGRELGRRLRENEPPGTVEGARERIRDELGRESEDERQRSGSEGVLESEADWARYMPMWEEYVTDPDRTPADELVTYIYVPLSDGE